jgi:RHS repeat-associated protein
MVARYMYDPFGRLLAKWGILADANVYRFSSKEWDENAGLYHYPYRFYDPNMQRWLNRDPLGQAGGANLYGFVYNSPVNLFDPFGLIDCNALAAGINHQENTIDKAIQSMGDINNMYRSSYKMSQLALEGELSQAAFAGGYLMYEMAYKNAAVALAKAPLVRTATGEIWRDVTGRAVIAVARKHKTKFFKEGTVEYQKFFDRMAEEKVGEDFDQGIETMYDEGFMEISKKAVASEAEIANDDNSISWNFLNEAEGAAEKENELGNDMSESTSETISDLQMQLAEMLQKQSTCCQNAQ